MYSDFSQIVVLDTSVNFEKLSDEDPFWNAENDKSMFSVRQESRATSIATEGKGAILIEVQHLERAPNKLVADVPLCGECNLHLPSGNLGFAEILDLENPEKVLPFPEGRYHLRATMIAWSYSQNPDTDLPLSIVAV